jgi:hypothetical protein
MFTVELVWGDWCQDIFQSFHNFVSLLQGRCNDDKGVLMATASGKERLWHCPRYVDTEGSLPGASNRSRVLVCGGSRDPNHDAVMRIKSKAPGRRAHSLMTAQRPCSTTVRHHLGSLGAHSRCRVGFRWSVPGSSPMRLGAMRRLAGSHPSLPDAKVQ